MGLGNHDDKEETTAPLLDEFESARAKADEERDERWVTKSRCLSRRTGILLHAILIALYTAIFIASSLFLRRRSSAEDGLRTSLWSPASEHIKWETRHLDGLHRESIYAGKPNSQADAAWHELLQNMNLRILPHEIENLKLTALDTLAPLADGTGFVGVLSVFHQLHCIKRIRWWVNRDYYYPNISWEEAGARYDHVDHCIEILRETAVCRSDTEVIPLKWAADGTGPTLQKSIPHHCVNWEALQEWAGSRRLDLFNPGVLESPPPPSSSARRSTEV